MPIQVEPKIFNQLAEELNIDFTAPNTKFEWKGNTMTEPVETTEVEIPQAEAPENYYDDDEDDELADEVEEDEDDEDDEFEEDDEDDEA